MNALYEIGGNIGGICKMNKMIDKNYALDKATLNGYYESRYFKPTWKQLRFDILLLFLITAFGVIIIYITTLLVNIFPKFIPVVIAFEFIVACCVIIYHLFQISKNVLKTVQNRTFINDWLAGLEKFKAFRLVITDDKIEFYSDTNLEGFKWDKFNAYFIDEELIRLSITPTDELFFILKSSVGEEDFEVIKKIVAEKIKQ